MSELGLSWLFFCLSIICYFYLLNKFSFIYHKATLSTNKNSWSCQLEQGNFIPSSITMISTHIVFLFANKTFINHSIFIQFLNKRDQGIC